MITNILESGAELRVKSDALKNNALKSHEQTHIRKNTKLKVDKPKSPEFEPQADKIRWLTPATHPIENIPISKN